MQLMRLADAPVDRRDRVFRYSKLRAAAGALVLGGIALGAILFGWLKDFWLAYYIAAVIVIYLLILHRLLTARFRQTNWLVRMTDNGLFVKFRSYLNYRFPDEDLIAVFIPYSEIRSAKLTKERQELPDHHQANRKASTVRKRRFIELELAGNSDSLADALGAESKRVFAKRNQGGAAVSARYQHLPVRLSSPTSLRIEWGVVPGPQSFLDALTRHTLVQPPTDTSKNFADLEGLGRKEQEARLLELAESGDAISAVALARQLYSYGLTEAKQFVDSLIRK
jgi:hypothetical protein